MFHNFIIFLTLLLNCLNLVFADGVLGCGGFVKSDVEINFSLVEVKLYTPHGSIKYQTDCAPNTGYYLIPLYDKGDFILKVEPPQGWTFEPESIEIHVDGEKDKCSLGEDINFVFTGFSLEGKVVSKGQVNGPSSIPVSLSKKGSSEVLQTVITNEEGSYHFSKVLPGEYDIRAKQPDLKFIKSETQVKVTSDNGNAGSEIVVAGYSVSGQVVSEGEPIKGVNFLLYSSTIKQVDVYDCNKSPVAGVSTTENYVCHVISDIAGKFTFPCLATGEYYLVPFYKGDLITFDVVPEKLPFQVGHGSVKLSTVFQVAGFSVTGQVLDSAKGSPVAGTVILLNGNPITQTGPEGVYHLENMKTGVYKIEAKAENMFFDPLEVKITPNTPSLPVIAASSFSLCGKVVIDKLPEGLSQVSVKRKLIIFPEGKGSEAVSRETNKDGTFCTTVKPGKHIVRVHVSDAESKAGLLISPSERTVTVTNRPVLDIVFSQFRAKVSGIVTCIEKCGTMEVSLEAVGRSDKQIVSTRDTEKGTVFTFDNIMPGKYKVTVLRDNLCWKEKTLDIDVTTANIDNLNFLQTGYILKCTISHAVSLHFAHEKMSGTVGLFELNKGKNRFCLAQPGVYRLTPDSCHKFERDVYTYDSSVPETLTLTAVSHLVYGAVRVEEPVNDIIVTIRSSLEKEPVTLGPLTAETKTGNTSTSLKGSQVYKFQHWTKTAERLEARVKSSEMLYSPDLVDVTVSGDSCPGELLSFTGRRGIFVEGFVKPPLSGVRITVLATSGKMEPITMETEESGTFRIGPLDKSIQYDVLADKEGYVLAKEEGEKITFMAFQLGKVAVKILDEAGKPLSDVLLSLSGGKQYRSNNVTKEDGSMVFADLSPGQYFLRPMMKEYKFEPVSQMIDVLEGTTMDINILGVRVAYSCYGQITSLNGEPEPGVIVEAVGKDNCSMYQEESKTEQNGHYRIRGLQPKCAYEVRLKIGDMNKHIERAAPKFRSIVVSDSDLTDVNMIAFRRMNQMDISGNVVTQSEFLPTLKVRLYHDENPGVPIHTVSLGMVSFFYLPSLQMDDKMYTVRLESSLSKATHEFTQPEIELVANISYKHITFKFEPKRKSLDQELSQGSLLILPLTVLIIMVGYNYQKILPYGVHLATNIQQSITAVSRPRATAEDYPKISEFEIPDSPVARKKTKPRRT